jgi:hypothetical protein
MVVNFLTNPSPVRPSNNAAVNQYRRAFGLSACLKCSRYNIFSIFSEEYIIKRSTEFTLAHILFLLYLTFILAGDEYGMGILKVKEIIGIMSITAVP